MKSGFLILTHEAAITINVRTQDGSELTLQICSFDNAGTLAASFSLNSLLSVTLFGIAVLLTN